MTFGPFACLAHCVTHAASSLILCQFYFCLLPLLCSFSSPDLSDLGFVLTLTARYKKVSRVENSFLTAQRQADFHPEI